MVAQETGWMEYIGICARIFRVATVAGRKETSMHYVVYCQDDPETPEARDAHYPAHRLYLAAATVKLLLAGPFTEVRRDRKIGSMLVVEASDIEEVRAFVERDPFYINHVWKDVHIHPYIKSTDNR
jgi:uncharacterized protein